MTSRTTTAVATLVALLATSVFGVDGISVTTRSNYTHAFGWHFGSIYVHTIKSNAVTNHQQTYSSTNARCVNISPSGTRIGFIRSDGKICVKSTAPGGSVSVLTSIPKDAWMDWPTEDWIYFTDKWQSNTLKRVKTDGSNTVETVGTGLGSAMQMSVASDLTKGTAVVYSGGYKAASWSRSGSTISLQSVNAGCGAGISPNGAYFTNNISGHSTVAIRPFNGGTHKSWNTSKCSSAGPNWNRLRWSANSNDWVTFTQGGPYQLEDYHNQVLYYVPDGGNTYIQVTSNSNGTYDEGDDFWVGNPDAVLVPSAAIGIDPTSLSFAAAEDAGQAPDPQEVTISNVGASGTTLPSLIASSDKSWLDVEVLNDNQSVRNSVNLSGLSSGVYDATVTISGSGVSSKSYSVRLVYKAAQVFTSIAVTPGSANVAPGRTLEFSAQALDQDSDPMNTQPDFTWSVDGSGSINSSGVYTAPVKSGGPYTIKCQATINGSTKEKSVEVTVQDLIFRMNFGGNAVYDWIADEHSANGDAYTFGGTHDLSKANAPAPNEVYQTCRHNAPTYEFPASLVPDGKYKVRLHFSDKVDVVGARQMDISIEGDQVLNNYDIFSEAGGTYTAIVEEFVVTVDDGNGMTVAFANGNGNDAFAAGIEVYAVSGGDGPPVTLLSPNGGESYTPGDTMTIEWTCDTSLVLGVNVKFSYDNGVSWVILNDNGGSLPSHDGETTKGSFKWVIPDTLEGNSIISSECLVEIKEYYDNDGTLNDKSDSVFSIDMADPVIATEGSRLARRTGVTMIGNKVSIAVGEPGRHIVRVYSAVGELIFTRSGTRPCSYSMDSGSLSAGPYVIMLQASGKRITKAFAITK